MDIVILGLSITSSWGNGHATTFRGLVRELAALGHRVTFLERDVPWYAAHRDLPHPPYGRTWLYRDLTDLRVRFRPLVEQADAVIVGSYVPDGIELGEWMLEHARGRTAFYDIDTPVTLAALTRGACDYLSPALIRGYQLYLSFTGGPTLQHLERDLAASPSPGRCIRTPSAGRTTSSGASTCRRTNTARSTTSSASPSTSPATT